MFKDAILNNACSKLIENRSIVSKDLIIYTNSVKKKGVSPLDIKRYYLDSVNSVPYGNYKAGRPTP